MHLLPQQLTYLPGLLQALSQPPALQLGLRGLTPACQGSPKASCGCLSRACRLLSGSCFTVSVLSGEPWGDMQVAGLGEGGLSPPSGALAGCEPREVSGAPLISPPSSSELPHQSIASSASRAGFARLCDCPEPALAECSAASGLPGQNCRPCSPAGLSDRLSNGR